MRDASVSVINDGLGYARVYKSHAPGETIISTRAGAIPIFRNAPPERSLAGWRTLAGAGWFMGERTPIDGVQHLPPATFFQASPRSEHAFRTADVLGGWTAHRPSPPPDQADHVAAELARFAQDVGEIWTPSPTIHLSGGRDSRAAAAGFVARGVPARFHTVATLSGELDIARKLLSAVGRSDDHSIVEERDTATTGDLRDRTAALHLAYDGVYGPAGVKQAAFQGFDRRPPVITGAAGEIARGNFYKGNFLASIRRGGDDGPSDRLDRLYAFHGGVSAAVHSEVTEHIRHVIAEGRRRGVTDVSVLDYFYLAERLRRWSNASTRIGTLTPLATPAYVRAAFDQSPEAKLEETLHLDVIRRLVPSWGDIPFYKGTNADSRRMTRPRIWDSGDRQAVTEILEEPSTWDDVFEPTAVHAIWDEATSGNGNSRHEMLIQRVVWRSTFGAHLHSLASAAETPVEEGSVLAEDGWTRVGVTS